MIEAMEILSTGAKWLIEKWVDKLTSVIESMTEERPALTWHTGGSDELGEQALILEQRSTVTAEPLLWLGIPESVHQEFGRRILSTAGVETSDVEENRATCLEAIEQSLVSLNGAIAQRMNREITREQTTQCAFFPSGLPVIRVVPAFNENELAPLWIAFSPLLISWLEEKPAEASVQASPTKAVEPAREILTTSRTFDLLLDVSLPVSISFGRAELPVKEVLKLTTGSIVELNRSISEPVDIIVNGCTIARGEVVVVDGNYGVRINSIVSRNERMRVGSQV